VPLVRPPRRHVWRAFRLFLQYWCRSSSTTLNIGGRPYFVPAFIPVTFDARSWRRSRGGRRRLHLERLPEPYNPVFTFRARAASRDRYSSASKGRSDVQPRRGARTSRQPPRQPGERYGALVPLCGRCVATLVSVLAVQTGCRNEMYDQAKAKPLSEGDFFRQRANTRVRFLLTSVARGFLRADKAMSRDRPDGKVRERVADSPDTRALGARRERFDIFCSPCHGKQGRLGMIVERGFKQPASLHEIVCASSRSLFLRLMTQGFGQMSSYASQVPPEEPLGDRSLRSRAPILSARARGRACAGGPKRSWRRPVESQK